MNTKLGKRNYQIIVIVMAIAMGAGALSSLPVLIKELFGKRQAVAVVNGLVIGASEYNRQVVLEEQKLAVYREQLGEQAELLLQAWGIATNSKEAALEQLINDKVILSVAHAISLRLNPAYVAGRLADPRFIAAFLGGNLPQALFAADGTVNLAIFKKILARQGLTVQQFEELVENTLQEHMVLALAQGAATVSESDKKEALLRACAPKTIAIVEVPFAAYLKEEEKQPLSEEAIAAYFAQQNQRSGRYFAPEKRTGKVWTFKQKGYDLQESDATGSFEKRFTSEAQAVAHAALGADALNRFVTQKNGSLRELPAQELSKEKDNRVNAALFGLTPGSRTVFVVGDTGYIVELTAVQKAAPRQLETVRAQVVADMYQERAQKAVERALQQGALEAGKKRTITLAPGDTQGRDALRAQGLPVDRIDRMFLKGQTITGLTETAGYRIELTDVGALDAAVVKAKEAELLAGLERSAAERAVYELIASSRERATITMNSSL